MWVQRKGRGLKEQFVNGIIDDDMMTEIIRELMAIMKTNVFIGKQISVWPEEWRYKGPRKH